MQAMAADMQGRIGPEFFTRYGFNELERFSPRELEAMGRLATPVFAGPGDDRYRPIGWDEAMSRCVTTLHRTPPDENFFYVSGRSSNEAGFLWQLFARLYGTNNVNNCSYYCHQASGVGLTSAIGTGTATVTLDDLDQCDLLFLIGGNPASNHPRLMRAMVKIRRRGGEVIVVNPIRELGLLNFRVPSDLRSLLFGSSIANLYVQPHIGGDIAFLSGVAKRIIELHALDDGFIERCTEGWSELRGDLVTRSWGDIEKRSGVAVSQIHRVAEVYAASQRTIFAWTMGITHHLHGVDNVRAIANLALMRGMVGRDGAGLLPIRGHSNVQGIGSVGVTPKLKQAVFDRLESHFGVRLPTSRGMDTLSCLEAIQAGRLRAGWCLGGNLFGASPDANAMRDTFRKLDSVAYLSTTLNTGHVHGRAKVTLILPVLARDEEPQPTSQESMFNFVRLSDGGPRRHEGPRSEVEIIAELARGVLGVGSPIDWAGLQSHRNIRQAIGAVIPGYEKLSAIDETRREFHVGGRSLRTSKFSTVNGRAKFHAVPIPDQARGAGELTLMTLRSEGQFNTVVYEEEDLYRHQERRDVILMNRDDIERLGLRVDQQVTVRSEAGKMRGILVREWEIRAGNAAMYYPEANVLVLPAADPESRTPAFKAVPITLVHESEGVSAFEPVSRPVVLSVEKRPLNAC